MLILCTGALASLLTYYAKQGSKKEGYTDPSAYVPWVLIAIALVITTMTVNALSPILNVVIAAAILWYVWKVPTVKTMAQNAIQGISSVIPKAPAVPVAPAIVDE